MHLNFGGKFLKNKVRLKVRKIRYITINNGKFSDSSKVKFNFKIVYQLLAYCVYYTFFRKFAYEICLYADEPGAPGTPEATDWDKDHVDLRWTPPASDGGSPITGYVIEKREKGSTRWTKAGESKGPDCKGTAENLEEGMTYEFRVRAVNAAGPGEPSQASKPVTAKPRKCKYIC